MRNFLRIFLFLFIVPLILFQLRGLAIAGGDSDWIVLLVERPLYFFFRAPLVIAFHRMLWLVLGRFGWSPADCVSLSSSLAGGFFFLALFRISRNWRAWLPILVSCLPLLFIGHRETYAWPYALTLWCFYLMREHLKGRVGPFPVYAVLLVATFAHPMVLMIWPGLAWSLSPWTQEKLKPLLLTFVLTFLLMILLLIFGKAGGLPQRMWVLPLFEIGDTLTRYPLFSWIHWKELGWFYLVSMPVGAILFVPLALSEWKGWKGGILVTALLTLTWSVVWHPGMSYADWDLFAWPGLFVNLAVGLAWSERAATGSLGSCCDGQNEKSPPERFSDGDF